MRGHRPIKDFPGYWISWKGHVYSDRKGGYLVEVFNPKQYLRVSLWCKGVRTWKYLHRLSCEHYNKNPNPKTHTEVHHIFFDKTRNGCRETKWVTPEENKRLNKRKMFVLAQEDAKRKKKLGIVDPF